MVESPERAPLTTTDPPRVDEEALIEEARERQRRRRIRLLTLMLVAVVAAGIADALFHGSSGGRPAIERIAGGPVVHVSAFSHHGRLAFVSHGTLWLLDGGSGSLRRLPAPTGYFASTSPLFSADGKWLAYLERSPNGVTAAQLWLARGDGADAHRVGGLAAVSVMGWSPSRDILAVTAGPERKAQPCPCYSPTTLRLVALAGSTRILAHAPWVSGVAWSPSGDALAVATVGLAPASVATLASYPVDGGKPTVWLQRSAHDRLNDMTNSILDVAGWSAGEGIAFWVFGNGAVHNNDATPLDAIAAPGARPRLLGQTLSDGTTDAIAASGRGELAIVTDHGGGRAAWQAKQVEVCPTAGPCRPVASDPSQVTVEPSWSPDGTTLAFVQAPNVLTGPWSQTAIAAWFAAHRVRLEDAATGRQRELPAARGATALTWSADGTSLLFVKNDRLWLLPTLAGAPVEIASPLFPRGAWPQYYAQIPWADQFAWSSTG